MALTIATHTAVPTRSTVPATQVGLKILGDGAAVSCKVVTIAWDTSYPTGGETADFSGLFPTAVLGAVQIAGTLNDEGAKFVYIPATPSTGIIQAYWYDYDAVADGLAVEVANTTNLSAVNGQVWAVFGY